MTKIKNVGNLKKIYEGSTASGLKKLTSRVGGLQGKYLLKLLPSG